MEELLIIVLQFLFELILNIFIYGPLDWPSRDRTTPEREKITSLCFLWFLGGCALAGISLIFFKHSLISIPELRVANLLLAPVISAYISQAIAERRANSNSYIIPRNHFWQAFWFTLGLVAIRFAYISRV